MYMHAAETPQNDNKKNDDAISGCVNGRRAFIQPHLGII